MDTATLVARLLTPQQTSDRLALSVSTLAKMRCLKSDGPVFIKIGAAVRYPEKSVEDYMAALPRRRSTSDVPASARKSARADRKTKGHAADGETRPVVGEER